MKALVTGAAGFIGSHLSEALVAAGADVVGVDCFTDYYARDVKESNLAALMNRPKFRFVEAGLQTADLPALLDGVTHVFHLAAQAGVRHSWGTQFLEYTSHNVDSTQRLLEAVKHRTLHRFVFASSSSVYGDVAAIPMREDAYLQPLSPYGVTKLAAEHLCHLYFANYGVPTVSLRFSRCTARDSGPTWRFTGSSARLLTAGPSRSTATADRRGISRLSRTLWAPIWPRATVDDRAPSITSAEAAASRSTMYSS